MGGGKIIVSKFIRQVQSINKVPKEGETENRGFL